VLELPELAIDTLVVAEGGASRFDGFLQDRNDGARQGCRSLPGDSRSALSRRDSGLEKSFANINVAKPRDHALVEESRLDRRFLVAERAQKQLCVECIRQGLCPESPKKGMFFEARCLDKRHQSETTMIGVYDARGRIGLENDVIVLAIAGFAGCCLIDILSQLADFALGIDAHAPAHSEMHDKRHFIVEVGKQIFGTTPKSLDPSSGETLRKSRWKGNSKIAASRFHKRQSMTFENRREAFANGLNFRKLRHGLGGVLKSAAPYTAAPPPGEPILMSVPFGFVDVPEEKKEGLVHQVFSSVAERYDLMNDLMSGGIHRLWKDAMVDWLAPRPGQRFLDVACGTGDVAFRIASAVAGRSGDAAIV